MASKLRLRLTVEYTPTCWPFDYCLDGSGCHEHGCPHIRATCPHALREYQLAARLEEELRAWKEGLLDLEEFVEDQPEPSVIKLEVIKGGVDASTQTPQARAGEGYSHRPPRGYEDE